MELCELEKEVVKWAEQRGLLGRECDSFVQLAKVMEEVGELAAAMPRRDPDKFKDGVGDVVVTLIILAEQNRSSLKDCLEIAFNEIKDRKGKMVGGSFIKESDLNTVHTSISDPEICPLPPSEY